MRKSEATPFKIQIAITERERLANAKVLASREKCVNDSMDEFYMGKSTDSTNNYDGKELNSWMSP